MSIPIHTNFTKLLRERLTVFLPEYDRPYIDDIMRIAKGKTFLGKFFSELYDFCKYTGMRPYIRIKFIMQDTLFDWDYDPTNPEVVDKLSREYDELNNFDFSNKKDVIVI